MRVVGHQFTDRPARLLRRLFKKNVEIAAAKVFPRDDLQSAHERDHEPGDGGVPLPQGIEMRRFKIPEIEHPESGSLAEFDQCLRRNDRMVDGRKWRVSRLTGVLVSVHDAIEQNMEPMR